MSESFSGHCAITLQHKHFFMQADFKIPAKGMLGIFGDSGSGKTTLLRCIAGLKKKVQGDIQFNGQTWLNHQQQLSSQQRHIG